MDLFNNVKRTLVCEKRKASFTKEKRKKVALRYS